MRFESGQVLLSLACDSLHERQQRRQQHHEEAQHQAGQHRRQQRIEGRDGAKPGRQAVEGQQRLQRGRVGQRVGDGVKAVGTAVEKT